MVHVEWVVKVQVVLAVLVELEEWEELVVLHLPCLIIFYVHTYV